MISHGSRPALFLLVGIIYEQTHDRQSPTWAGSTPLPRYARSSAVHVRQHRAARLSGFIAIPRGLGAFRFNGWVAAATMLVVIISAVYMLWMFQRVFFTVPSDWMRQSWAGLRDINRNEWISLAPLLVLVVVLGVYPGPVLEIIAAPVDRIIDSVRGAGLSAFGPLW